MRHTTRNNKMTASSQPLTLFENAVAHLPPAPKNYVTATWLKKNRDFFKITNLAIEAGIKPQILSAAITHGHQLTVDESVRLTAVLARRGIRLG